jgi:hypothetical protein
MAIPTSSPTQREVKGDRPVSILQKKMVNPSREWPRMRYEIPIGDDVTLD